MAGSSRVFRIPEHVVCETLEGETIVLNLRTGKYFALNRTATRIWQLLESQGSEEAVCGAVSREFAVDPDRVRADFESLVASLEERGLLEVS